MGATTLTDADNNPDIANRCPAITTAAGVLDRHAECELSAGHGGPHRDSDHPQAFGPIEWPQLQAATDDVTARPFDAWDAGEAVFQALEDLPIAQRVMAAVFAAHSHVLRGPLSDRQAMCDE
jgi:hypothetical protein